MEWGGGQLPREMQQQQQQQQQIPTVPPSQFASQFYLLPLIEAIADSTQRGQFDQNFDELVNELGNALERCNQLLIPFAQTTTKPVTLRSQKLKLQEHKNQLELREEALAKYKTMVDKAVGPSS